MQLNLFSSKEEGWDTYLIYKWKTAQKDRWFLERCNYVPIPYGVGKYRYFEISWDESDLEAGESDALSAAGFKSLDEYKKKEEEFWQS